MFKIFVRILNKFLKIFQKSLLSNFLLNVTPRTEILTTPLRINKIKAIKFL